VPTPILAYTLVSCTVGVRRPRLQYLRGGAVVHHIHHVPGYNLWSFLIFFLSFLSLLSLLFMLSLISLITLPALFRGGTVVHHIHNVPGHHIRCVCACLCLHVHAWRGICDVSVTSLLTTHYNVSLSSSFIGQRTLCAHCISFHL
jgi:hypothetical protein